MFAAPLVAAASIADVGIGASAVAGGVGALSSIMGGQANANLYNYRAQVAKANQTAMLQNAGYAETAGETQALEQGRAGAFRSGNIKAAQGASNLDVNRGSAPGVRASQTETTQLNENVTRYNAARTAYGYETSAAGYGSEAAADTMGAETSKTAGDIGAATSLLSATSSVSSKWLQASASGLGTSSVNVNPSNSNYYIS